MRWGSMVLAAVWSAGCAGEDSGWVSCGKHGVGWEPCEDALPGSWLAVDAWWMGEPENSLVAMQVLPSPYKLGVSLSEVPRPLPSWP